MSVTIGGVDLYMGPTSVGGPDDLDQAIRDFIDDAKHSLAIAVQEIDSRPIAKAILAAKLRGVRVRVILEGDYLTEEKALIDPWTSLGAHEENRIIQGALLKAKVDVIADLNPKIFHQKFIVRDPGAPTAAVLTGSTNFTLTDTGTNASGNNLNHVLILRGQTATGLYLREFERLRSGTFGELRERREPKPREFRLGRIRIKPIFAPHQGPEMEIMKQMLKARARIDFAMFTFAQSSGIDDAMARLVGPGLPIRGILDRGQGAQRWAATQPLKAAGV